MKKTLLLIVMLVSAWTTVVADELIRFDLNNYTGWDYTRPGFLLNSESIGQNNVNLFKEGTNPDYTLISPLIDKRTTIKIIINVLGYSKFWNNSNYDPYKGSPTIEILDPDGNVLKNFFYQFGDKAFVRNFSVRMIVADLNVSFFKIRLACWSAGIYDALSVREVVIEDGIQHGDVNGDGTVTSADVTAIYDYLLNGDTSSLINGDQDGDGIVTASDVTAVYNILLGV